MIGLAGAIGLGLLGAAPTGPAVIDGYDFTGATLDGATLTRASAGRYLSDSDVLTSAAIDAARFDYTAGAGLRGLLIEPARTNVFVRSEEFDNASWTKNATTVTANAAVAPDGASTADRIVETTASGVAHNCQQTFSATSGQPYTFSVYAKAAEVTVLGIAMNQVGGGAPSYFNLLTGAVTAQGSHTATIESVGNGWYRCTISITATSTATASFRVHLCPSVGTYIYAGNASNGALFWGAQMENAATATSYIPTTTVAVARSADVLALVAPTGTATARYTFDDDTTQDVATAAGAYNAPTNLNRPRLRSVAYL